MKIVDQFGNLRPMSTNVEIAPPMPDDPIADIINAANQQDFPTMQPPWWTGPPIDPQTFQRVQEFKRRQLPTTEFTKDAQADISDTVGDDQEGPTVSASKRNKGDRQRRWYNGGSDT